MDPRQLQQPAEQDRVVREQRPADLRDRRARRRARPSGTPSAGSPDEAGSASSRRRPFAASTIVSSSSRCRITSASRSSRATRRVAADSTSSSATLARIRRASAAASRTATSASRRTSSRASTEEASSARASLSSVRVCPRVRRSAALSALTRVQLGAQLVPLLTHLAASLLELRRQPLDGRHRVRATGAFSALGRPPRLRPAPPSRRSAGDRRPRRPAPGPRAAPRSPASSAATIAGTMARTWVARCSRNSSSLRDRLGDLAAHQLGPPGRREGGRAAQRDRDLGGRHPAHRIGGERDRGRSGRGTGSRSAVMTAPASRSGAAAWAGAECLLPHLDGLRAAKRFREIVQSSAVSCPPRRRSCRQACVSPGFVGGRS